jgi:hypothetical protein
MAENDRAMRAIPSSLSRLSHRSALLGPCCAFALFSVAAKAHLVSPGTESVTIPWASGVTSGQFTSTPEIEVSVNGDTPEPMTLDTGSVGLMLPPNYAKPAGPEGVLGTITYGNGKTYSGNYYSTKLVIGTGAETVTATVPVLFASTCTYEGAACATEGGPVLGVGFLGGKDVSGLTGVQKNPLLNITAVGDNSVTSGNTPGDMTKGYIVMSGGLTVGLTATNTQGYSVVQLPTSDDGNGWGLPMLTLTVNGATATGTVLNDTGWGVDSMVVIPTDAMKAKVDDCDDNQHCTAAEGNSFSIEIGDSADPRVVSYSFAIGTNGEVTSGDPPAARTVKVWLGGYSVEPPYVNTGTNFFNRYDYFYDYTDGLVGYETVPEPATWVILGIGFAGIAFVRYHTRHKQGHRNTRCERSGGR